MQFITDFADQAVVLPVAFAIGVALLLLGWRRAAFAWALCVPATLAVMLALKLVVLACVAGLATALGSPSGHTAGAAVVYGGAPSLLAVRRRAGVATALVAAVAVAGLIGATRLALGVHTLADVTLGGLVGMAGAGTMRALAGPRPPLPWRGLAAAALIAMLLCHGWRLDAEPRLRWAAAAIWPLSLCQRNK